MKYRGFVVYRSGKQASILKEVGRRKEGGRKVEKSEKARPPGPTALCLKIPEECGKAAQPADCKTDSGMLK